MSAVAEAPFRGVAAEALTRVFGRLVAVDGVDLRFEPGSIFGFVGPSGSGKTTVIRMLCGLLQPTSGSARVAGFDIDRDPERLRQHIGYMAQRFSLYPDLTAAENLRFYGGVYGLAREPLRKRIAWALERLELASRADDLTASLPLGLKQRVALAAALLHEPPVLFLDEPTSGVDPASRRLFWELLDELAAGGATVFVTTHAMDEAERCHRVGIMFGGRLIAADTPAALKAGYSGNLYAVHAEPLLRALDAARGLPGIEDAAMFGTDLHVTTARDDTERLRQELAAEGIEAGELRRIAPNMEDVFVQLVRRSQRDGA